MLTHIPFTQLFKADHGWLKKSSFHFSFAEYVDSSNMHYGPLRVMNDDFIGPKGTEGVPNIYQDANMYVSEVDKGKVLDFDLQEGRQLYLKVMEGSAEMNGMTFIQGDAGKLSDVTLKVKALSDVHILLVEMQEIT